MDRTSTANTAAPHLVFDDSNLESATDSVITILTAIQQALAATDGKSPLTAIQMAQLAAAATGRSLLAPVSTPVGSGLYSSFVSLRFPLAPDPDVSCIELIIPPIGPEGAHDSAEVTLEDVETDQAITIFRDLWAGLRNEYATFAGW